MHARRFALRVAGPVLVLWFAGAAARAATLTVNSEVDDTVAANGLVTLREAIRAAETDGTTDLGETGNGPDTIVFDPSLTAAGDAVVSFDVVGDTRFGPSAFVVTTTITLQGPSGGRGVELTRGAAPNLRAFAVTPTGSLTLENLSISFGRAMGGDGGFSDGDDGGGGGGGAGLGGAIYNQGILVVRGSTLSGNSARGGNGGAAADNLTPDSGGGGGGGGLGGNGGSIAADQSDGGGGGGGSLGNGGGSVGGSLAGGGGGGTSTNGADGTGGVAGLGGTLGGGAGGTSAAPQGEDATGPGGGGGGGGDEGSGGAGGFGGGGGGSGESDLGVIQLGGAGGFGGGGGGGGEDNSGGLGGFGGGGGGGSGAGTGAAGGFGAGAGGIGVLGGFSSGGGGGGGFGGAIVNHNGTLTLVNTTVSGNSAVGGDGGAANGGIAGSDGEALGGGLFNLNGSVTLQNVSFANNLAGRGTDVFHLAHETTGGVTAADATLTLTNTVLASLPTENIEIAGVGVDPGDAVLDTDSTDLVSVGVTNSGGTNNDGGLQILDPFLGALLDNGGPTWTHAPQLAESPVIDASTSGAATDQRGVTRPQGARFDIGAVEVPKFTGVLAPGDLLLSEFGNGSVVDIQGGGDFKLAPRFAYGLDDPFGLCMGPGSELYATEFGSGEVTLITAGGDFRLAPPFATGLTNPINLLCTDTQILVVEFSAGQVTDITAGGDASATAPFAFGLGSVVGLFRDSGGTLWASNQNGNVYDISAGGDFSAATSFASMGGTLKGVTERDGALLVADYGGEVLDFTAGGNLGAAPVFATVPAGPTELLDLGPLGLFTTTGLRTVYEISAGGDFSNTEPFATGVLIEGGFSDLVLVEGCGDGLLDAATEECDDANLVGGDACSATCKLPCAPAPEPGCIAAAAASVKLDERKAGKEKLGASLKKFASAVSQADFGDPVGSDTRFALCLYDASDALVLDVEVDRAGELCGSKQKPCWKALGMQGYAYKDPDAASGGATKLVAKGGAAGKGSLVLQGKNNLPKGLTQLPTGAAAALEGDASATLQVLAKGGECLSAELATVRKAAGGQFKAKTP